MLRDDNNLNRLVNVKSKFVSFVFVFLFNVLFHVPSFAHNVTIFAWVDGDNVHTQSKFSGGEMVHGGDVIVLDSKGTHLHKGKTDENGIFSFKIPRKTELKVILKTSMGHMAVWKIPAREVKGSVMESNISSIVENASVETNSGSKEIKTGGKVVELTTMKLGREEIEEIIDASLDRKLTPIIDMIGKIYYHEPGFTEIIGGIGYIVGLVGVALYFSSRRKKIKE